MRILTRGQIIEAERFIVINNGINEITLHEANDGSFYIIKQQNGEEIVQAYITSDNNFETNNQK